MKKKIILCGSMKFFKEMGEWKEQLEKEGFVVETPTLFDLHIVRDEQGDLDKFNEIKRVETRKHFDKVKNADILLILNFDKNGRKNYIGGATFAEIAYAVALNYCHDKNIEIFTVNPIPDDSPYTEELIAWDVRQ